jgi:uncharacterized peroxidase-related enzyme
LPAGPAEQLKETQMPRIDIPTRDEAPAETHAILDTMGKRFGFVPNLFRLMAMSPPALRAFVGIRDALSKAMDINTVEAMGMAVSEDSGCDYCLATHTYLGSQFGKLTTEELVLNRQGTSGDAKRAAAVVFAKAIANKRGKISDSELADVRRAGFSDAQIITIAALTAQFLMTNFMNNVSQIDVDFPVAAKAMAA